MTMMPRVQVTTALPTCVLAPGRDGGRLSVPAERPVVPRRIGRYVLTSTLGTGGMATVSLAKLEGEAGFSRPVAIKQLLVENEHDEKLVAALLDEARLVSFIRHPNVVPILDVIAEPGSPPLVVMEYVFGDALSGLVASARARREAIPVAVAAAIAIGVLEGLHASHEARDANGVPIALVHRDVSPQNILVGADGIARVTDFGIAKALGRAQQTTEHGVAKGKLMYMPPEQFGGQCIDRRADVWSVGVVLWEMLTGKAFFPDPPAMFRYHLAMDSAEAPSRLRRDAAPLDEVVLRALEHRAEARFGNAREMAIAIEKAITPASTRRIGQFVRRLAREKLAEREADLRELGALSLPVSALSTRPTIPPTTLDTVAPQSPSRSSSDQLAYVGLTVLLALVLATGGWIATVRSAAGVSRAEVTSQRSSSDVSPPIALGATKASGTGAPSRPTSAPADVSSALAAGPAPNASASQAAPTKTFPKSSRGPRRVVSAVHREGDPPMVTVDDSSRRPAVDPADPLNLKSRK